MATKLAASEDKLGSIHELTAEYCKQRLEAALTTLHTGVTLDDMFQLARP